MFSNCGKDTYNEICNENAASEIYIDANGITIKANENAVVGESYELNGACYISCGFDNIKFHAF